MANGVGHYQANPKYNAKGGARVDVDATDAYFDDALRNMAEEKGAF